MKQPILDPVNSLFKFIGAVVISILIMIGISSIVKNEGSFPKKPPAKKEKDLFINVQVYSYQLKESQTDIDSTVGAFGDTLEMDVGIVALSRDLKYFFNKNDTIHLTIQNKKHTFVFKDIMGPKHRNSVDLLTKENIRGRGQLWLK